MVKKKGFTLIELIAVLVIMAIIALIVVPLVMNTIRKARISSDKRSIDAYGRSIELAISGYLLDTGKFPTSIEDLTIEYSGSEVVCSTTQLNSDSSVYLTGCTVAGRIVDYTYGSDKSPSYTAYNVGAEITYNGVDYYVIKNSGVKESTVTLLKSEPLLYEEIQIYSAGTEAEISNQSGYGGMQYHLESSVYETSYIKAAVDAWKEANASAAIQARLMTIEEVSSLGYEDMCVEEWCCYLTDSVPNWVYNSNYWYWTMNQHPSWTLNMWIVHTDGSLSSNDLRGSFGVVRPVIVLSKDVLE